MSSEEGERFLESLRQTTVSIERLGNARRMIVGEDYSRCVVAERLFGYLARIDGSAVKCAAEEFLERNDAVPVVEIQYAKDFVRPVRGVSGISWAGHIMRGNCYGYTHEEETFDGGTSHRA